MENEYFNHVEIKFFSDIYKYLKRTVQCDISGHISASDVHDFLLNSFNLSDEVVNQIGIVSDGGIQGWYSEKELFVALKLVAAAQIGLPISSNVLMRGAELPLPNLLTNNNIQIEKKEVDQMKHNDSSSPDLIQLSDSDCSAFKKEEGGQSGYHIMISEDDVDDEHAEEDPNSDIAGNFASQSPSVSSPASESPTPTNSVYEKNWKKGHDSQWQSLVNEERRQLLGTEEDSSDRHSSEGDEDEEEADVYTMTEEQQQYYSEQFLTMQSDLNGLLPGSVAKEFFEKSRLPIAELSKIWQLCDVTRDGALSLEEFFAAMHLVVLRRNNIPLPDSLPFSLMPKAFRNQNAVPGGTLGFPVSVSDACRRIPADFQTRRQSSSEHSNHDERENSKPSSNPLSPTKSKEWAKFVDSPMSTLSSPGPKPVNFDFHKSALEKDPKILHPKPLRLTPESKNLEKGDGDGSASSHNSGESDLLQRSSHVLRAPVCNTPPKPNEDCDGLMKTPVTLSKSMSPSVIQASLKGQEDVRLIGGPPSLPLLSHGLVSNKKDLPPPPPPPRPVRAHVRSSSLDLNKFCKTSQHGGPPLIPPRSSPLTGSPQRQPQSMSGELEPNSTWENRLSNVSEDVTTPNVLHNSNVDPMHVSAFEVYKKPPQTDESASENLKTTSSEEDEKQLSSHTRLRDKRDLLSSLHSYREKNAVLSRVNSELNQELAEVIEERIALEFQLEQMKPFSN